MTQTVNYGNVVGVEWCVLTNGDEYRIYNVQAPVYVDEKLFRTVRISESDESSVGIFGLLSKVEMADKSINLYWKADFVDRRVKEAVHDLARKKTSGLHAADIRASIQRAVIHMKFPLIPATSNGNEARPRKARQASSASPNAQKSPELKDLIRAGLLRPPVSLESEYKGTRFVATIEQDGTVNFGGKQYDSLSTAAGMARKSVIGRGSGKVYPQTNGWLFWKVREPGTGKLCALDDLRKQYIHGLPAALTLVR